MSGRNGNVLFSHAVAHTVFSELKSLTTVFEMGTGVPSSLLSPARLRTQTFLLLTKLYQRRIFLNFTAPMRQAKEDQKNQIQEMLDKPYDH